MLLYTKEFRQRVVDSHLAANKGKKYRSLSESGRRFGIPAGTVSNWLFQHSKGTLSKLQDSNPNATQGQKRGARGKRRKTDKPVDQAVQVEVVVPDTPLVNRIQAKIDYHMNEAARWEEMLELAKEV